MRLLHHHRPHRLRHHWRCLHCTHRSCQSRSHLCSCKRLRSTFTRRVPSSSRRGRRCAPLVSCRSLPRRRPSIDTAAVPPSPPPSPPSSSPPQQLSPPATPQPVQQANQQLVDVLLTTLASKTMPAAAPPTTARGSAYAMYLGTAKAKSEALYAMSPTSKAVAGPSRSAMQPFAAQISPVRCALAAPSTSGATPGTSSVSEEVELRVRMQQAQAEAKELAAANQDLCTSLAATAA